MVYIAATIMTATSRLLFCLAVTAVAICIASAAPLTTAGIQVGTTEAGEETARLSEHVVAEEEVKKDVEFWGHLEDEAAKKLAVDLEVETSLKAEALKQELISKRNEVMELRGVSDLESALEQEASKKAEEAVVEKSISEDKATMTEASMEKNAAMEKMEVMEKAEDLEKDAFLPKRAALEAEAVVNAAVVKKKTDLQKEVTSEKRAILEPRPDVKASTEKEALQENNLYREDGPATQVSNTIASKGIPENKNGLQEKIASGTKSTASKIRAVEATIEKYRVELAHMNLRLSGLKAAKEAMMNVKGVDKSKMKSVKGYLEEHQILIGKLNFRLGRLATALSRLRNRKMSRKKTMKNRNPVEGKMTTDAVTTVGL